MLWVCYEKRSSLFCERLVSHFLERHQDKYFLQLIFTEAMQVTCSRAQRKCPTWESNLQLLHHKAGSLTIILHYYTQWTQTRHLQCILNKKQSQSFCIVTHFLYIGNVITVFVVYFLPLTFWDDDWEIMECWQLLKIEECNCGCMKKMSLIIYASPSILTHISLDMDIEVGIWMNRLIEDSHLHVHWGFISQLLQCYKVYRSGSGSWGLIKLHDI